MKIEAQPISPLLDLNRINSKQQLTMDGKTFHECWFIEDVKIKDTDNVVVNFINNKMVNIFVNGNKIWSVIKGLI